MAKSGRPSPGLDEYVYWLERLENRVASDLSIDDFCEAEGISSSTFYRWGRRLKDGIPEALKKEGSNVTMAELAEAKFLPVSVTASPVEIQLPNGGVVRLRTPEPWIQLAPRRSPPRPGRHQLLVTAEDG